MRRIMYFAILFLFTTVGDSLGEENAANTLEPLIKQKSGTVRVAYHKFSLLRHNGKVIALHLMPDPRFGFPAAIYTWFETPDAEGKFYQEDPNNTEYLFTTKDSPVKFGSGQLSEPRSKLKIKVDNLLIEWSAGNTTCGWLYLRKAAKGIQFYPQQFDAIADFHGRLDEKAWIDFQRAE